jgi:hypothetical protein
MWKTGNIFFFGESANMSYICVMAKLMQRNTLLRYRKIRDLYLQHKTEDIPDTVILRKYIYPVYPISRSTLNNILATNIEREFQKLLEAENAQQLCTPKE